MAGHGRSAAMRARIFGPTPTPSPTPDPAFMTFLMAGSSTMQKAYEDFTGPVNAQVSKSTTGATFVASDGTGQGASILADLVQKAINKPVRYIGRGNGGTTLAGWIAPASSLRAGAVAAAKLAPPDVLIVQVGFNDAFAAQSVISQAAHEADLRTLISQLRSETGMPNLKIALGGTQRYTSTGNNATRDRQLTWVRAAEMAVASDPNVFWFTHSYDQAQLADGIHMADYAAWATRAAKNILAIYQGTTVSRGPTITGITAVDATTTDVALAHSGASDFTPTTAITGFNVSIDDFSSFLAVSAAVRQSATSVRLTHATAGSLARKLRAIYGSAPDITGLVRDNAVASNPINPTATSFSASGTPTPTPTPTSSLSDTFTAADGTNVIARSSDCGHSWSSPTGTTLIADNGAYGSAVPANATSSWVPEDDFYVLRASLKCYSDLAQNALLRFRIQDDSNYYYAGKLNAGGQARWCIGYTLAGTAANPSGSLVDFTAEVGRSYALEVRVPAAGGTIELYVDGVLTASLADNRAALAPKGLVGLRTSVGASGATTGWHFMDMGASKT